MAEGRAAAALARFDRINRELADRRALRERKAAEAKQRASDNLARRGEVAERSAKHLIELAKRQRANSGFDTGRSREEEEHVLRFGAEDETAAEPPTRHMLPPQPPASPAPPPPPRGPAPADDHEDDDFSHETYLK
ncbi:hypothetical protein LY13_003498 [Prauserella aidingensis]|uniref:hypothetical protein n=1 Tax=Prauserella aidingensis TaxID=387890 RepID=UPI0020A2A8E5|nr:hypothetical protein [Prauserella aidingensis]MCP2254728.1 hypothetical protein [Prauserella aidingensis]